MRIAFRLSLLAAVAVYLALVLWSLPRIEAAANGLTPFDLRPFGYSGEEARAFLSALTDAGRAQYAGPQRWLDMVYPALLALTLVLGIFRFGARFPLAGRVLLSAVAVAGSAFDYLENARVAAMLALPPAEVTDAMAAAASQATVAKSGLGAFSITMVLILAVLFGVRRRRRRRQKTDKAGRT
jgi:hypothetical protein